MKQFREDLQNENFQLAQMENELSNRSLKLFFNESFQLFFIFWEKKKTFSISFLLFTYNCFFFLFFLVLHKQLCQLRKQFRRSMVAVTRLPALERDQPHGLKSSEARWQNNIVRLIAALDSAVISSATAAHLNEPTTDQWRSARGRSTVKTVNDCKWLEEMQ